MKRFLMSLVSLASMAGANCGDDAPRTDEDVRRVIGARFEGDRSGACVVAAVIEPASDGAVALRVSRASRCAGARRQALDGAVALEIGSISKTMTGTLLASLIAEGKLALEDPLAKVAPVPVPSFGGIEIRLKHLVTHTSGLPSIPEGLALVDPANPYAALTEEALWAALPGVPLARAPGARWEYSNFAVMLLSSVIAKASGGSYEDAARARIFAPLGMSGSYVATRPAGVSAAVGHRPGGVATSAWDFAPTMAGVGGVRATMDDMIRYAKAQLGDGDAAAVALVRATHAAVPLGEPRAEGDPEMGMGWVRAPFNGRLLLLHDGGTGGFSSFLGFDEEARRAVVVLADTQLSTLGGVTEVGLHLLDETFELEGPRQVARADAKVIDALVGRYRLDDGSDEGIAVELQRRGDALGAVVQGEELALGYDSHGQFYPLEEGSDGLLVPVAGDDGRQTFVWIQDGVPLAAQRL